MNPARRIQVALLFLLPLALAADQQEPAEKRVRLIKQLEDQRAALEQFEPFVGDERPAVRVALFRALGRLQDEDAVPALSFFLSDRSATVRREAIDAIGLIGKPDALEVLLAITRSSEADERRAAAFGVGLVAQLESKLEPAKKQQALERMVVLLRDADPGVRGQAALAIGFLGLPAGLEELAGRLVAEFDPAVRWRLVYGIGRIGGEAAVPHLARAAELRTIWCREFASMFLARSKSKTAAAPLVALAGSPLWKVAAPACRGLARHPGPATLAALERALEHWSWHVRAEAARALGELGAATAAPLVRRRLRAEQTRSVRAALLSSLIRLDPRAGMARIRALAKSAPPHELQAAAEAAGALAAGGKHPGALALAEELFERGPHLVRSAVLAGLDKTTNPQAQALLLRALKVDDLAVRGTAAENLKALADPSHLPSLVEAYQASTGRAWYEVRESLVEAIGKSGGKQAEATLRAALKDPAPSVREKAAAELKRILGREVNYKKVKADPPRPPVDPFSPLPARPEVVLETDKGDIRLVLYPEAAPIHVRNFLALVQRGFYDGLLWHRVVSAFVIQGGDPRGDGWGDPGYTLRDETSPLPYRAGTLGMPKAGKDTGGCQLFITHLPTPHLEGRYTVFGQVTDGMGTLDRIEVGDRILRARRVR